MKRCVWMIGALAVLAGCRTIYYDTMEAFGHPKRQILSSRVQDAQESQVEAKEQFQSALERFRSVVEVSGGSLEEKYEQVRTEYEKSKKAAEAVNRRSESLSHSRPDLPWLRPMPLRNPLAVNWTYCPVD